MKKVRLYLDFDKEKNGFSRWQNRDGSFRVSVLLTHSKNHCLILSLSVWTSTYLTVHPVIRTIWHFLKTVDGNILPGTRAWEHIILSAQDQTPVKTYFPTHPLKPADIRGHPKCG